MTNNDILKRIRYVLNLNDLSVIEMIKTGGRDTSMSELSSYFQKEDEPGFKDCSNSVLIAFFDGLIVKKRGPSRSEKRLTDESPAGSAKGRFVSRNNAVMKKLRIALELKDDDMIKIFKHANFKISKSEISALFRRQGHKNYRECGDQILRNFIQGLTKIYRNT